jgi:threonylcarbamoyladenosine tRNA methylthiotransferase MtaB
MAPEKKIITCGCRFNRHESAEMLERLGDAGEDMVVVNTCAVTKKSEAKSKHAIRRAVYDNPGALIVAAGCLAELSPDSLRSIKGVGLVLGNEEKFNLRRPVQEAATSHTGGVRRAAKFLELTAGRLENRSAAYLKVQNGCDEACSFCVVRVVRGRSRSARVRRRKGGGAYKGRRRGDSFDGDKPRSLRSGFARQNRPRVPN